MTFVHPTFFAFLADESGKYVKMVKGTAAPPLVPISLLAFRLEGTHPWSTHKCPKIQPMS